MSELDKLLAHGEDLAHGRATINLGELMRFRSMAKRVKLPRKERNRLLLAIKNGFSSANSSSVLFTSDVLVHALHGQKLTSDEIKWLFTALVEIPDSAYSFGGTRFRFPRNSQYRMLAMQNGREMSKMCSSRIRLGDWIHAGAAVYSVTRDAELLLGLMEDVKMHLSLWKWEDTPLEVLAELVTGGSDDVALKDSLLALLMQQVPGSRIRSAIEEQLLKLATQGKEEQMRQPERRGNIRKASKKRKAGRPAKDKSGGATGFRTWLADESVERLISNACNAAERELSQHYDASPRSNEERLTGVFLSSLERELQSISPFIQRWAEATLGQQVTLTCGYEDIAARGPEKVWGADVGFYVQGNITGRISFQRAVLAQVKKAIPETKQSWTIEPLQRDLLLRRSPFSIYLLYGSSDVGVAVLPAATVHNVMLGAKILTRIHRDDCAGRRPFHEFFVNDLIGDWWGDRDGPVFDLRNNALTDFAVRWLFTVTIATGTPERG